MINNRLLKFHQCEFVPRKSTAIQAMGIFVEKFKDAAEGLHNHLNRSRNRIPHDLVWTTLCRHGVTRHIQRCNNYKQMYIRNFGAFICATWCTPTTNRCTSGTSAASFGLLGVHRGNVLSLLLFNIVRNFLTSKTMQELLLSVLFADNVGLCERVDPRSVLQVEINHCHHELRLSQTEYNVPTI